MTRTPSMVRPAVALALAGAVWLPLVQRLFPAGGSQRAAELARSQLALWEQPAQLAATQARMRASNAEWDFMGRTFLSLALANMALRQPAERARYLAVIDRIVDDTLRLERERGQLYFLMPYGRQRPFVVQPARSLFVDGELALMLGARCLVEDRADWRRSLRARAARIAERMGQGATLSAESYPDECWTFCNTAALAGLALADRVLGTDHQALAARWVARARQVLIDPHTGLLVSKYSLSGAVGDGPEGSSIWASAHWLQVVDPAFARDQYERARHELGRSVCGFGYAREWPASWVGPADVDSGPLVPLLDASAGSSGLALLAAGSFGDRAYQDSLLRSLELAAFPIREGGGLRHAAGNQVGDAALLYSLVCGPLWDRVRGVR